MKSFKHIIGYALITLFLFSCTGQTGQKKDEAMFEQERQRMVDFHLKGRDITDENVLKAMNSVLRHQFVPEKYREESYYDGPLPIGENQTISQPYIVALMTQLLKIDSTSKVLEIGTGSGYQAAVLGEICDSVFTIEIIETLAYRADSLLDSLGYNNIHVRAGDGYLGWPEAAPFDAVIVTAAAPYIPEPLVEQMKVGGRMVIPVGDYSQDLLLIVKEEEGYTRKSVIPVRFVPMTGEIRKKDK